MDSDVAWMVAWRGLMNWRASVVTECVSSIPIVRPATESNRDPTRHVRPRHVGHITSVTSLPRTLCFTMRCSCEYVCVVVRVVVGNKVDEEDGKERKEEGEGFASQFDRVLLVCW